LPESDPADTPVTRTYRSRSWLVPALALVVVLVTVVAVGRLGQTNSPPLAVPSPAAQVDATLPLIGPGRSLTVVTHPIAGSAGPFGTSVAIRSEGDRYDDGIPALIDGNQVVRVADAAALPAGAAVLVGGWAQGPHCQPGATEQGACPTLLSDLPFTSPRVAALELSGQADFDYRPGPRIYLASIQSDPGCTLSAGDVCLPQLTVGAPLWTGDGPTSAAPFAPVPLISDLAAQFPKLNFRPFEETSYCPVNWPIQSYVASDPDIPRAQWSDFPIRIVVIYPTAAALAADGPASRAAAAALSGFDASNRCVSIPGGVDDKAWVVRDNVMILLGQEDAGLRAQVEAALDQVATPI
jgi:hypothetical protein